MTTPEKDHAGLYEMCSWAPTQRLLALRDGAMPKRREVHDLYGIYLAGCRSASTKPSITEFGSWLLGNDPRGDRRGLDQQPPADVFW